MTHALISL